MPINYKKYPPNWQELRKQVLKRSENKCEFCGIGNYEHRWNGKKNIKIILTIAHLDHDEENYNVNIDRLSSLCQKCHLTYDIEEKKRRRQLKRQ